MPCRTDDYGPTPPPSKKTISFEAVLCGILTFIESNDQLEHLLSSLDWKEIGYTQAEVETWWMQHKIEDLKRREREAETARKQLEKDKKEYERLKKKLGV